jgi:hypothetical protein
MDLTTWPKTAKNVEDALKIYNDIGLLKKIQFKKFHFRKNEEGLTVAFSICCYKRRTGKIDDKIRQGIKLKNTTLTK